MVGSLRDVLEVQKGLSLYHYVEAMRTLLVEIQSQTKKAPLSHRKTLPIGLFCMSGPVAHADDEEDEDPGTMMNVYNEKTAADSADCKSSIAKQTDKTNPLPKGVCVGKSMGSSEKSPPIRDCIGNEVQPNIVIKQSLANGCVYEGKWGLDGQGGRCKIRWPSGSSYEGEVVEGCLHGVGTYKGADGSIYKGNWKMNKKKGFGWKQYANGDAYEGTWKWDVPDGQGRYIWSNGSEYYGEWKHGLMSGRGVLVWPSGDKYDGNWFDGLADGCGVYTWADGSTYFGVWRKGRKHGIGRFFPPGSTYVEGDRLSCPYPASTVEDCMSDVDFEAVGRQKVCSPSHVPQELRRSGFGLPPDELAIETLTYSLDICEDSKLVLERIWKLENSAACLPSINEVTYSDVCVFEDSDENFSSYGEDLSVYEADYIHPKCLIEERRQLGETVCKGHRNYDLMTSLQLGIRHCVGKVRPEVKKKLVSADFGSKARTKLNFPREGSQVTPPHQAGDFKWKDYCPTVFRHLRELFDIDTADYMLSLCGNNVLKELPSPGKSGSVFYLSQDERFMIKTLKKTEVKVLLRMLPRYYKHVQANRNTLLTRFLGLHRFKNANGQKVRLIIMGNVVSTDSWIHRRFDLKGSSQGRSSDKDDLDKSTTLKDLDLEFVFQLEQPWREAVLDQISKDCKFLESEHIMDYSLLLGLHFKERPPTETTDSRRGSACDLPLHDVVLSRFLAESGGFVEVEVIPKQPTMKNSQFEVMELKRQGSLKSTNEDAMAFDLLPSEDKRQKAQIGYNIPAKAHRRPSNGKVDLNSKESYNVLLYFGVIDILQEYDMGKKLEHAYKSFQFDSLSISAVDPVLYSKRFQQFMREIFVDES